MGYLEEPITQHERVLTVPSTTHQVTATVPSPPDPSSAVATLETRSGPVDPQAVMDEAVSRHRKALELLRRSYPDEIDSLPVAINDLAAALVTRFGKTGRLEDVDEAVALYREVLKVQAIPQSESSLNLAAALKTRFDRTGRLVDLDEAVLLDREVLTLFHASNVDRTYALNNLATALHRRFDVTGLTNDLYDATDLHKEALNLRTVTDPHRSVSLNNLALACLTSFHHAHISGDLDMAIPLFQEAIKLQPSPHPDTLHGLADALYERYNKDHRASPDNSEFTARIEEATLLVEEATTLNREAIELLPASNPNRASLFHDLAQNLVLRQKMLPPSDSSYEHLAGALKASQESGSLLPEGHLASCRYSMHLGKILLEMYDHNPKDAHYLEDAVAAFRAATNCESVPVWHRFQAATEWTRVHVRGHYSACEAYQAAIKLRIRLAPPDLDLESRMETSDIYDSLLSEAIACAIQLGRLDQAVEFFAGRGAIFWSQTEQLRPQMDELRSAAPELAQKLEDLSRTLEEGSLRPGRVFVATDDDHIFQARESLHYRRLSDDWVMAVAEVRKLDGFEGFLLPKPFSTLHNAAANGPVVMLCHGDIGVNGLEAESVALVMTSSGVKHLRLPLLTVKLADELSKLIRQVVTPLDGDKPILKAHLNSLLKRFPPLGSLLQRPHTSLDAPRPAGRATHLAPFISANSEDIFRCVLAISWKVVVEPVIRSLNLEKSESLPRIWWCPTGVLAQLPIHAAGIYGVDGSECVSDYVVSSYIPSLSALLAPPPLAVDPAKVMVVIQPHTLDYDPLPYTLKELQVVEKHVPKENLVTFGTPEAPALVEDVLSCLSTVTIAHFACHGEHMGELENSLILHDGEELELSRIMGLTMPNASLAFLCACETGSADGDDAVVNFGATLLFAGFRGAVATMWSIADEDGPNVADSFYRHLFQPNRSATDVHHPDITQAARALHLAVAKLRSEGCTLKRWVPFIHLGL